GRGEPAHSSGVRRDGVGQDPRLSLFDLKSAGRVIICRESREYHRKRLLPGGPCVLIGPGAVDRHTHRIRNSTSASQREILLCDLELVQESIFVNVDLVEIDLTPQVRAVISDVPDLDNGVPAEFPLQTDIPALDITGFEIGTEIGNIITSCDCEWVRWSC